MKHLRFILFLCCLIQFFTVYLFTSGFFLVKEQVSPINEKNPFDGSDTWFKQKAKVIFFIIDALRFDFFYYNESIAGHEEHPYQNKFINLHNLVQANPENFIQFKTFADPPTVTVHRVQAMLTGNLPPFVEIAENFGSSAISEDNIMRKLTKQGKTIHLVGDDIWMDFFPNDFNQSFPVKSFDIHDFDTVDDAVKENIFPLIRQNDFDLLIGHMLGIDHVGHTFGIYHEKMGEKLAEMDEIVAKIIRTMDDNTVLFVMGDHGMSEEGDHGGGSKGETETVVGAYYKGGFQKYKENGIEEIMKSFKRHSEPMLTQLDLTPTLAMLLGIPIPFSNVGHMINDFYVQDKDEKEEFIVRLLKDNYVNMLQTAEYMKTVQEEFKKFPDDVYLGVEALYEDIKGETERMLNDVKKGIVNKERGVKIIKRMQAVASDVYELVKRANSYDFFLMTIGIGLACGCFLFQLATLHYIHIQQKLPSYLPEQDFLISRIKKSKFVRILSIATIIICSVLKLGILKTISVLVFLMILISMYLMIQEVVAQSKVLLHYLRVSTSKGLLSRYQETIFIIADPLETFFGITAIAFHMAMGLSVYFTRLEKEYLQGGLIKFCKLAVVLALLSLFIKGRNVFKHVVLLILLGGIFYCLPLYDLIYYSQVLKTAEWPETLLYTSWVKILLPLAVFDLFMFSNIKRLPSTLTQILQFVSLALVNTYYILATITPDFQKVFLIQVLIPRLVYGLILLVLIISAFQRQTQNPKSFDPNPSVGHSSFEICTIQLLLLLAGHHSVMAFVLLYTAFQVINKLFSTWRPDSIFHALFIGIVSSFGYFCTGHSNQVTNIQVAQGFVGFDQYSPYTSAPLVLLNTMASFILGRIFLGNFERKLETARNNERLSSLHIVMNSYLSSMFFGSGFIAIGINSFINHSSLLLIYDFAPKYLIDTAIYVFVLFIFLFSFVQTGLQKGEKKKVE